MSFLSATLSSIVCQNVPCPYLHPDRGRGHKRCLIGGRWITLQRIQNTGKLYCNRNKLKWAKEFMVVLDNFYILWTWVSSTVVCVSKADMYCTTEQLSVYFPCVCMMAVMIVACDHVLFLKILASPNNCPDFPELSETMNNNQQSLTCASRRRSGHTSRSWGLSLHREQAVCSSFILRHHFRPRQSQ